MGVPDRYRDAGAQGAQSFAEMLPSYPGPSERSFRSLQAAIIKNIQLLDFGIKKFVDDRHIGDNNFLCRNQRRCCNYYQTFFSETGACLDHPILSKLAEASGMFFEVCLLIGSLSHIP